MNLRLTICRNNIFFEVSFRHAKLPNMKASDSLTDFDPFFLASFI